MKKYIKEDNMPNIAECSIQNEHYKFELVEYFLDLDDRETATEMWMNLKNSILMMERNTYAGIYQILEKDRSIEEMKKDLLKAMESHVNMIGEILKKITDA